MKHYIATAALVALAAGTAQAQQTTTGQQPDLHKEITMEKDFVPVEKKAVKKNTLPTVKKTPAPARTTVNFSDWAAPIDVPSSIPTMMPYGYRTAHNFSDKRGYFDFGGGTAANFAGSAGYRFIDRDNLTVGAWLQHNSTWTSRNATPMITDGNLRLKQKVNDNLLGIDLMSRLPGGTLNVGVRGHFDSFNYYGGLDNTGDHVWADDNPTQSFYEAGARGAWEGLATFGDGELTYDAGLALNHARYDKAAPYSLSTGGDNETTLNVKLGGEYTVGDRSHIGVTLEGDVVHTGHADLQTASGRIGIESDNYAIFTFAPYFRVSNRTIRLRAGVDFLIGNLHLRDFGTGMTTTIAGGIEDGARLHLSPNVEFDAKLAEGAAFYATIGGGKTLNTMSALATMNRYSDPNAMPFNGFSPFDGEAGFKIGPFSGFAIRIYGGYGIFHSDLNTVLPTHNYGYDYVIVTDGDRYGFAPPTPATARGPLRATRYAAIKTRGMKVGTELSYRYRSLVEAKASLVYAPTGDDFDLGSWHKGYSLDGIDGANLISNIDLKIMPLRQLTVDLGLQLRSQRSVVLQDYTPTYDSGQYRMTETGSWYDLEDAINLHAGAAWRFDKTLTLWAKASNLLNRRYDIVPGMGAQRFNVMGGVALVF